MPVHDTAMDAHVALTRFGLGVRPGEAAAIDIDPLGFVIAQLDRSDAPAFGNDLPSTRTAVKAVLDYRAKRRNDDDGDEVNPSRALYRADVIARARHAVSTDRGYVERLTMFWSSFFAIAADKAPDVRASAGAFEREAIRPHVLGRFADMLEAATKHPAMLHYLDNSRSFGPNSVRAQMGEGGLNENLARETLELHSLGVDGGYGQGDVTALAKVITGWRAPLRRRGGRYGTFVFDPLAHEPGSMAVLGRDYAEAGLAKGEAAIADLAAHPATARNVARRLTAEFLSERPPPRVVAAVEEAFRDSGGDLKHVAAALVMAEESWTTPPVKFLPPYDFVVAAHRATSTLPALPDFHVTTRDLGQPTWDPPSPEGWPAEDSAWAAPDALVARADWASAFAEGLAGPTDVVAFAETILGQRLSPATRQAIARAATRPQGIALMLASSEFQTR
jgi:uncharacterized protein (DUF1800 family)